VCALKEVVVVATNKPGARQDAKERGSSHPWDERDDDQGVEKMGLRQPTEHLCILLRNPTLCQKGFPGMRRKGELWVGGLGGGGGGG